MEHTSKRKRLQFSLRTLLILSLVSAFVMAWWFGRYGRWAAELTDEKKRDAALFNLLQAQRYHDTTEYPEKSTSTHGECKVNHVIVSRPLNGDPVYAVFKATPYKDDRTGPGIPMGHIIVIDSEGYIRPWFLGRDVLDGEVLCPLPGASLHAADSITFRLSERGDGEVSVLYVVSLSHPEYPELLVAYNREKEAPLWDWHVNKDTAIVQIELGPKSADGSIEPKVHYVWSQAEQKYLGPDGAPAQHFLRLDSSKRRKQMNAFYDNKRK